jgi:hypothetical protein
MSSVVAGRDFLRAGVLVRLIADLAVFLQSCVVEVMDDGLTFVAGMNIPVCDARVRATFTRQGGFLKTWSGQKLPLVLRRWPWENVCAVMTSEGVEPEVDSEASPGRYHQNLHPHGNRMMEEQGPGTSPYQCAHGAWEPC